MTRVSIRQAKHTLFRAICLWGPKVVTRPFAWGFLPGCTGMNRRAATRWCNSSNCWRRGPSWRPAIISRFTRSATRRALNREFWRDSAEPEVKLLQAELTSRSFQGIIALHTDDTSDGFYGFVRGATLTRHLIEPALQAAEKFLPRDRRAVIDGFNARNGVIRDCYDGVLSAPPRSRPRPFEIILETPQTPPEYLKVCAFVLALQTILAEYRKFIAYAQNI